MSTEPDKKWDRDIREFCMCTAVCVFGISLIILFIATMVAAFTTSTGLGVFTIVAWATAIIVPCVWVAGSGSLKRGLREFLE